MWNNFFWKYFFIDLLIFIRKKLKVIGDENVFVFKE